MTGAGMSGSAKNDFSYIVKDHRVHFPVRVLTKSSKTEVCGLRNGALLVRVNAAPEKGKANEALTKCLADYFGVAARLVEVESGRASHTKIVSMPETAAPDLDEFV